MIDFEWPAPGESWWRQAASDCRASDMQAKYAALRINSTPSTEAYRRLTGEDGNAARSAAHRLERSVAVQNLIGLHRAECAGLNEGTVSPEESRQILSRIARNGDPSTAVRALEALSRLEEKATEAAQEERSPDEIYREIAELVGTDLASALCGRVTEKVAEMPFTERCRRWIHEHPVVAQQFVDEAKHFRSAPASAG